MVMLTARQRPFRRVHIYWDKVFIYSSAYNDGRNDVDSGKLYGTMNYFNCLTTNVVEEQLTTLNRPTSRRMWGVMCQLARLVVVHANLTAVHSCQIVFSALP